MKAIIILLLLCLTTPSWAQNGNSLYSIHADKVRTDSRDGVTIYEGHAEARVLNVVFEAHTISILRDKGLPSRIEASGNPVEFHQQASSDSLSGTARKITFLVPELKLTLIDYDVTDPSGNRLKGKKAIFELKP